MVCLAWEWKPNLRLILVLNCKALTAAQNEWMPKEPKILETKKMSGGRIEKFREEMQWRVLKLILVLFCILQLKWLLEST